MALVFQLPGAGEARNGMLTCFVQQLSVSLGAKKSARSGRKLFSQSRKKIIGFVKARNLNVINKFATTSWVTEV
jgi:hypothetical protein